MEREQTGVVFWLLIVIVLALIALVSHKQSIIESQLSTIKESKEIGALLQDLEKRCNKETIMIVFNRADGALRYRDYFCTDKVLHNVGLRMQSTDTRR